MAQFMILQSETPFPRAWEQRPAGSENSRLIKMGERKFEVLPESADRY